MENEVHLSEQVWQRLRLASEDASCLKSFTIFDGLALLFQMLERFNEEAAGAAGRVKDHFAELRVYNFHHEADDRPRRVELAGVTGGVAHLLEHRFVKMAESVDLVAAGEMDVADFIDYVAKKIAVDHAVDRAFEDSGDHVAPVTPVSALQATQIGKEASALCTVRADG